MEHFHQPSAPCPPLKRSCSQQAIPNLPVVLEKKTGRTTKPEAGNSHFAATV